MRLSRTLIPMGGWVSSLGIHLAALLWLIEARGQLPAKLPPATVSFSVVATESKAKAALPSEPQPSSTRSPRERSATLPARVVAPAKAAAALAKPAQSDPVDLSGVTLTAAEGGSWASMTGNGEAMTLPIRPTVVAPDKTKQTSERAKHSVSALPQPGIEPVGLRDLADKPIPPPLNTKLLANYPAAAKRQGLSGTAKVVARIDADGWVRQASTLFESGDGFGVACRETLMGSRWSVPRDKGGRAVPTQIHYTCQFRVDGS